MKKYKKILAVMLVAVTVLTCFPVLGNATTGSRSIYLDGARYTASYYVNIKQSLNRARAGITVNWVSGVAGNPCSGRVSVVAVDNNLNVIGGSVATFSISVGNISVSKSCSFIPDDNIPIYLAQGGYHVETVEWTLDSAPVS